MTSNSQTLAQRLAAGRLAVPDALRFGMLIAGQLRQVHEQGRMHGALSPATIAISGNTVELLPAPEGGAGITAYTAPEVLQGKAAESRSDIFSFGAIVYEMLTGRPAFDGDSPEALAAALVSGTPRPTGSPLVDRLVNGCLAKSPDGRFQRVQKLMLELKLLTSAARRAALTSGAAVGPAPAAARPATPARPAVVTPAPPSPGHEPSPACPAYSQVHEFESRIAARLAEQDVSARPLEGSAAARLEQAVDLLTDKLARMDLVVGSAMERLRKLERNLESFDTAAAALRDSVTQDIRNFERTMKAQGAAIESTRTAMGQTDDLIERVVEALDSLQTMFVSTAEEHSLAS